MNGRAKSPSTFSVFKSRSFTLLWIAQLISSMGSALTTLASSILVFRLTGSTLSVGLMLIATSGPTILIGLIAGVFVDRYDRKRIMLGSDLLRDPNFFYPVFDSLQYHLVVYHRGVGQQHHAVF